MLQEENLNTPRSSEEFSNSLMPETQNGINITQPNQSIQIGHESNSNLPAVNLNKLDECKEFLTTLRDKIFTAFLNRFSSSAFLRILIFGIVNGFAIGALEDAVINEPYKNISTITQIVSDTLHLTIGAIVGGIVAAFSIITHSILVTLYFKGTMNAFVETFLVSIFSIAVELSVGLVVDEKIAAITKMAVDNVVLYIDAITNKILALY
jgi:hypothetical protein